MLTFNVTQYVPKFILDDRDGYAMAKAIDKGLKMMADAIREGVQCVLDVDAMPEWRLDEMAWELNCIYDYHAKIDTKREWIRDAIPNYRKYGTTKGIEDFLRGYFGEVEVNENWEYGGDPFHFTVTVGGEWTPETETWTRAAVETVKSVRSVLDAIRPGTKCFLAIETEAIARRFKYMRAGELTAGEYPTENHLYLIDRSMQAGVETEGKGYWVDFDMAGEKPEINHLFVPDGSMQAGVETRDDAKVIAYGMAGEDMAGEGPEVNHLFIPDGSSLEGDAAEDVAYTIYYPPCGDLVCGE